MRELQQTDLANLYQDVAEAINVAATKQGCDLPRFVSEMMNRARAAADLYIEAKSNRECETQYDSHCMEYIVWGLALLSVAWVSEIFRLKTRDGHCYTHKASSRQPCQQGRSFHAVLHADFINSVRQLVDLAQSMAT
jgi:hypothetical protein